MLCLGDDNEMSSPYCSGNGDTVYRLLSGWLGEGRNSFYAVLHSAMAGTVYMVVLSNGPGTNLLTSQVLLYLAATHAIKKHL